MRSKPLIAQIISYTLSNHSDIPSLSVAEVEAQCDVEVDDAIWSMAEFEQLIIFISSSLIMTFPLYIICKHNHICGVEVCNYAHMPMRGWGEAGYRPQHKRQ